MKEHIRQPITDRDHVLGPRNAPVTLLEYGDFECSHCARAYPVVRRLVETMDGGLRFVFRHYPINLGHSHAQIAAEAAEAAAAQGRFWDMHDVLFQNPNELDEASLIRHAARIRLDIQRFRTELASHVHAARIAEDVKIAEENGVAWTPAFFVNDVLFGPAADLDELASALDQARTAPERTRR